MGIPLFRKQTIFVPTLAGWLLLAVLAVGTASLWWFGAEPFLASTNRRPADILVVEGWIGYEGIHAAEQEFHQGGYRYLAVTGEHMNDVWGMGALSYAETAGNELIHMGIPRDRVIFARARDRASNRTYESAVAVWRELQAQGINPTAINVFTRGAHARRSRLVFAKVFSPVEVGAVAWRPQDYVGYDWWRSSTRAQELLKETVGYSFEVLLNSGRRSNRPAP